MRTDRDHVTLTWHVDDADAVYQMLMDAAGHKPNGQPADHGWYDDAKEIERQATAIRERREAALSGVGLAIRIVPIGPDGDAK